MVRAVSLAGCFQPGAPLSLAAEKQLLLRHCLFDGNKYKPFGAVCQRVVSRGKGKISRMKQKETSERLLPIRKHREERENGIASAVPFSHFSIDAVTFDISKAPMPL